MQNLETTVGFPVQYIANTRTTIYPAYASLLPADRLSTVSLTFDPSTSTATYADYRTTAKEVDYRYRALVQGPQNPTISLVYAGLGFAQTSYTDGSSTKYGISAVSYGIEYNPTQSPLLGAAIYNGIVLGNARGLGSRVYQVTGTIQMNLNYDTTDFTGSLRLQGRDDVTGEIVDLGSFPISPFSLRGVLDYINGGSGREGRVQSRLAGPKGEELMGSFTTIVDDPHTPGVSMRLATTFVAKKVAIAWIVLSTGAQLSGRHFRSVEPRLQGRGSCCLRSRLQPDR